MSVHTYVHPHALAVFGLLRDAPGVWLLGVSGMGAFGIAQFIRLQRRRRLMEDLPTARIRSAPQGYVELQGRAQADETTVLSQLTGTRCAWHRWRVERRGTEGRSQQWELEEQGSSDTQFSIDDGSGSCLVDPEGAEFRVVNRRTWVGPYGVTPPTPGAPVMFAGDADHRYTEELIVPGETVHAIGAFASLDPLQGSAHDDVRELVVAWKTDPGMRARFDTNRDGELDMDEFAVLRAAAEQEVAAARREQAVRPQTHVLRRPTDGGLYLISTIPAATLSRRLRWQAWSWLAAGALLLGAAGAGWLSQG